MTTRARMNGILFFNFDRPSNRPILPGRDHPGARASRPHTQAAHCSIRLATGQGRVYGGGNARRPGLPAHLPKSRVVFVANRL